MKYTVIHYKWDGTFHDIASERDFEAKHQALAHIKETHPNVQLFDPERITHQPFDYVAMVQPFSKTLFYK